MSLMEINHLRVSLGFTNAILHHEPIINCGGSNLFLKGHRQEELGGSHADLQTLMLLGMECYAHDTNEWQCDKVWSWLGCSLSPHRHACKDNVVLPGLAKILTVAMSHHVKVVNT